MRLKVRQEIDVDVVVRLVDVGMLKANAISWMHIKDSPDCPHIHGVVTSAAY